MKRSEATYGQLDKVLRSLGFSYRPTNNQPPGRIYEHIKTGAVIMLPEFPDDEKILEHHMLTVTTELDNFGLADPSGFAARLQKAG